MSDGRAAADQTASPEPPPDDQWPQGTTRRALSGWLDLSPLLVIVYALLCAMVIGGLVMLATGANPFVAYWALIRGAVGGPTQIANSIARSTPYIGASLAIAFALKAGLFNIGAEGQILIGGLAAAWAGTWAWAQDLPALVLIPLVLLAGLVGGAVWGGIPGVLKATTGAHEVITTIMLNYIGLRVTEFLVFSRDPVILLDTESTVPHTHEIADAARLPLLIGNARLHAGILIAIGLCAVMWFVMTRTTTGFEISTVGKNPDAATYAGMSPKRTIILAMAVSGAFAGIAGAAEVSGAVGFLQPGVFRNVGFDSIAIALLARGNPWGIIPAALLWGSLLSGAPLMQLQASLSIDLVRIVQALILLFVAADVIVRTLFRVRGGARDEFSNLAKGWGA